MNKPNKQHTVSSSYLAQWVNRDGKFWLYNFKNDSCYANIPKTTFREKKIYNLNELPDPYQIETDINGVIENKAIPVIKKIQHSPITHDEKALLAEYIALQYLRTPQKRDMIEGLTIALEKERLDKFLSDPNKIKKLEQEEGYDLEKHKKFMKLYNEVGISSLFEKFNLQLRNKRELWLKTFLELLHPTMREYLTFNWILLESHKKSSFITSDNPVIVNSFVKDVNLPTKRDITFKEILFPLSPKFLLLMYKEDMEKTTHGDILKKGDLESRDSVKELNFRISMHCDNSIISRDQPLVISIAKISKADWQIRKSKLQESSDYQAKDQIYATRELKNGMRFSKRY